MAASTGLACTGAAVMVALLACQALGLKNARLVVVLAGLFFLLVGLSVCLLFSERHLPLMIGAAGGGTSAVGAYLLWLATRPVRQAVRPPVKFEPPGPNEPEDWYM